MFPKEKLDAEKPGTPLNGSLENTSDIVFDFETGEHSTIDGKFKKCKYEDKIRQYISLVLRTPRAKYSVYDSDFGLSIYNYIGVKGANKGFIISELKREIEEQLTLLKEVISISDFDADIARRTLSVKFKVTLANGKSISYKEKGVGL